MSRRRKIRALVVDDSAFMRKAVTRMLSSDKRIDVVAQAASGEEALEKLEDIKPDLITLDVVMPGMDGIEVLKEIMARRPTPVLMLSRLTTDGAQETLDALEAGAVDVVPKPANLTHMDVFQISGNLVEKALAAAGVDAGRLASGPDEPEQVESDDSPMQDSEIECVVIASSTGGPPALQTILRGLPSGFPAGIVVIQHMPLGFTEALAARLDGLCALDVRHASDGDIVKPGRVLVARSGRHLHFRRRKRAVTVRLDRTPAQTAHMPSADVTMASAARVFEDRAIGVVLTGMGADGAKGLLAMKQADAHTITEAESSAVIYGMPRVAKEVGASSESVDVSRIHARLLDVVGERAIPLTGSAER